MNVSMILRDQEGEQVRVTLPGRLVVCPRCNGRGVVDHEAFSNGISPEEFAEDPEFAEQYRSGMFDVTCHICQGKNVVPEPNVDQFSPEQHELWEVHQEFMKGLSELARAERAERMMGA